MKNEILLEQIHHEAYTRSEAMRLVGLIREFISFVCFTKGQDISLAQETVEEFAQNKGLADHDKQWLLKIPNDVWASFEKDTFHEVLDECIESINKQRVLAITFPVTLSPAHIQRIGEWVRQELGEDILLDTHVDPVLGVGCRLAWNSTLHDFSLAHFMSETKGNIQELIQNQINVRKEESHI